MAEELHRTALACKFLKVFEAQDDVDSRQRSSSVLRSRCDVTWLDEGIDLFRYVGRDRALSMTCKQAVLCSVLGSVPTETV